MKSFFQQKIDTASSELGVTKKEANKLSIARGITFLITFLLFIAFLSTLDQSPWVLLILSLIFGLIFYRIVILHIKKQQIIKELETIIHLNEQELSRLDLDLNKLLQGHEFSNPDHPYHIDLDIFGQHSLFQLLNRCEIPESRALLANWLSTKADLQEIDDRQTAVKELSNNIVWCQNLQVLANISINKRGKRSPEVSQKELIEWAKEDYQIKNAHLWKPLATLVTTVTLITVAAVIFIPLPYQVLYLLLIPNGLLLSWSVRHLNQISQGIDKASYLINTFLKTIPVIEKHTFKSAKLMSLRNSLTGSIQASSAIKKLNGLTHRLASRSNPMYIILDLLLLLDVHLLLEIYHWKRKNSDKISEWLDAINEMECLISLAGFTHANLEYVFPKMTDLDFQFEGKDLGHPLIARDEMVTNNYSLQERGSIDILTGSNMSGKSTFERTVGVNMVLAQMGAPVYASSLKMGTCEIYTSMRTVDDIEKHTSSFYAELKRIHELLEHIKEHPCTFVLIDEVLKGTNSEDRHRGALALVEKLTEMNAYGMVSTHDLSLGRETKKIKSIRNYSFNSLIEKDEIIFDYKLTPGLCKSFNASKLMEKMGIIN